MLAGFLLALGLVAGLILDRGGRDFRPTIRDVNNQPVAVDGLANAFNEKHIVKLLLVHGIGMHEPHEKRNFTDAIAVARLGFVRKTQDDVPGHLDPPPLPPHTKPAVLMLRTYTRDNSLAPGGKDVLIVYEVTWSPLVNEMKQNAFREEELFAHDRAFANRFLKQKIMNERLADAVLYLGDMGIYIRNAVKHSACTMANGVFDQSTVGNETCNKTHDDNVAVEIITWSLGSRITYDALQELETSTSSSAPKFILQRTFNIYMLANQLPLLGLATLPPKSSTSAIARNSEALSKLLSAQVFMPRQLTLPFTVIAVSDPNDL